MHISLPYGRTGLEFDLPEGLEADVIHIHDVEGLENPAKAVKFSLVSREFGPSIEDFQGCRTAAIAVNDKTRPVPYGILLPPLLSALQSIGIDPENITIIVANGTHVPMSEDEIRAMLPVDFPEGVKFWSHDCDDEDNLVFQGVTTRNTPVYGDRKFVEADLRIVTGTIEPHHFAGFSGGMKTASIGLSGRKTINHNHKLLIDRDACLGEFDKNPLRQDIEEIGRMLKVDFTVNVIMNERREIVHVLSGNPEAVIKRGVALSRAICQAMVKEKYDLVISSAGGYPKDINLYQAQKALTNASLLTKDGGAVFLVTACEEGVGSRGYEDFMTGLNSWQEVYKKFEREEFRVGPHKAFQFARELARIGVYLYSEIPDERVISLLLRPIHDITAAIAELQKSKPAPLSIAVLPKATNTLPDFTKTA